MLYSRRTLSTQKPFSERIAKILAETLLESFKWCRSVDVDQRVVKHGYLHILFGQAMVNFFDGTCCHTMYLPIRHTNCLY